MTIHIPLPGKFAPPWRLMRWLNARTSAGLWFTSGRAWGMMLVYSPDDE